MRVLVSGGAGYVGTILCEHLLRAGHQVTVLDALVHGVPSLLHLASDAKLSFVRGDARDERVLRELVPKADALIPLAAVVGAPACDRDPILARTLNLDAVRSLLRLRTKNQMVLYPTTNSGYGTSSGEVHCTEDSPLEPISLYGETKVEAERAVLEGENAVTLRLATVFGSSPRMRIDLLVNHFTYAAVPDGYLVLFEKQFKRNFVHVRDVADCFVYAMANMDRMAGRPYNLGLDSANMSKEELALRIKQHVPRLYLHFAEIGSDPDKRNYIVSNQRLREAGFEACRSIDEGIRELIRAYAALPSSVLRNV
jgi:nucleoside-diphosphate-sugar epimerase